MLTEDRATFGHVTYHFHHHEDGRDALEEEHVHHAAGAGGQTPEAVAPLRLVLVGRRAGLGADVGREVCHCLVPLGRGQIPAGTEIPSRREFTLRISSCDSGSSACKVPAPGKTPVYSQESLKEAPGFSPQAQIPACTDRCLMVALSVSLSLSFTHSHKVFYHPPSPSLSLYLPPPIWQPEATHLSDSLTRCKTE